MPVCHEIINLFIKPQNFLAFFFIRKFKGLYLIVTVCDGLKMIFLHFVCKLLLSLWEHHIATMPSEVFCLRLLTSKNQFVHPFLVDVMVIFCRVTGLTDEVRFWNELCQLALMGVIFSATKVLYNINDLGCLAIFHCPADLLGTCLRLFIDGHNPQFHCVKDKWHGRRYLYYMFWAPGEGKIFYNPKGSEN